MKNACKDVDSYICSFPEEIRAMLTEIRAVILDTIPNISQKISYGMPTFYLDGNLVHFAVNKKHIGLYFGASVIEKFAGELSGYQCTKAGVQLPFDMPIPKSTIKKMLEFGLEKRQKKSIKTKQINP